MDLTYTNEMIEQDTKYKNQNEDIQVMCRLHEHICFNAEKQKFPYFLRTYTIQGKIVTCIFENKRNVQLFESGYNVENIQQFTCNDLIHSILRCSIKSKKGE